MTLPRRWPLHPAPLEGEALSSWLHRVARCYRIDPHELLQQDLGHRQLHDLDIDPPAPLLDVLHRRSGVDLDRLRGMSLAGMAPWLLDSLDPDPSAYETYVHQLSVLLPPRKPRGRTIQGWRPWLPRQAIRRACPLCFQESDEQALLLIWRLPLTLNCPRHGCRLQAYWGKPGEGFQWAVGDIRPCPAKAPDVLMDRRTWQALTHGYVNLPRRRVHAGVWFRLLRTVLEELNTALSRYPANAQGIRSIWERCGYPVRAGLRIWRPYETLDLPTQLRMLEAAAIAMALVESATLTGRGTSAELFLPKTDLPIADERPQHNIEDPVDHWLLVSAAAAEVIAGARHEREAARALFALAGFGREDAATSRCVRTLLHDLDVPDELLSH